MTLPQALIIENGTLILPDKLLKKATLVSEGGKIVSLGKTTKRPHDAQIIDAGGGFISPGFIDIHVHGGAGADFMDGSAEAVRTAVKAHARHGTTSIFPPRPLAPRSRSPPC